MIKNILLVGVGGAAGSVARYLCQVAINSVYTFRFPLATLLVNVAGCFIIGLLYAMAERTSVLSPQFRLLLGTGFCGGFTTFSTFAFENMDLIRTGDTSYFLLYAFGSLLLGIGAVFAGFFLIR